MSLCDDCKTMHTCRICGLKEQCKDEINPGTCDFREHLQAHGNCIGDLTLKEKIIFYGDSLYIVNSVDCSKCGKGFASNTYCQRCVESAK